MTELIPLQVLFGSPRHLTPRLSPDGSQLAWIAPAENVLNVWLAPVSTEAGIQWDQARCVTSDRNRGIRTFAWARDGRHLLYVQDTEGDENWHLHGVDLVKGEDRDLTPFDGVQAQLVALERKLPSQLLVGLNIDDRSLHDVYRLDLVTGELTKEVTNPGLTGWLADSELSVRAATAHNEDNSRTLMVRDRKDGGWRELLHVPADDSLTTTLICFSDDGRSLLAASSVGADIAKLVRIDIATGVAEVLAGDDEADISDVRVHPLTREPQFVTLTKERSEFAVIDQAYAADLAAIGDLNHGDPAIIDAADSDQTWLVSFTSDVEPVSYYIYDRASRSGTFLFAHKPALADYQLAPMMPFSFTARDGLAIHGYATFPPDAGPAGLPTVLNVHGGPWARDCWGFHAEAQWLANRGYLCLQVNFRGSAGYGKAFVNAGDREWGGTMQDDLTDAVAFAIAAGWTDPEHVAIYGASYGGFAALAGAAFTPDLFCCAVDVVGPSSLITLIESIPPYWKPMVAQWHERVGNPEADADLLWSRSPLSKVASIKIPLLIVHGANDPRVRQSESEQIVTALTEAGIECEYMLLPDEGHGFAKPENRLRYYAVAERFLAKHLHPWPVFAAAP